MVVVSAKEHKLEACRARVATLAASFAVSQSLNAAKSTHTSSVKEHFLPISGMEPLHLHRLMHLSHRLCLRALHRPCNLFCAIIATSSLAPCYQIPQH
eukprot:scaffold41995_cov18-Prasinocladus_malaysianus.AAC.1